MKLINSVLFAYVIKYYTQNEHHEHRECQNYFCWLAAFGMAALWLAAFGMAAFSVGCLRDAMCVLCLVLGYAGYNVCRKMNTN